MQIECSTDLVFRSEATMKPLYQVLSREAVLSVKAEQVMHFLGKKPTPQLAQELDSRLSTRIEGTCIKHRLGRNSVNMYDKFGRVLRIETTTNDVSFFKHHRKVEHRDGHATRELAAVKKSIYSLIDLREILTGCNRRYLEFLSALDDFSAGHRSLDKLTAPRERSMAIASKASTSSTRPRVRCCAPCNALRSTSAACAAPICNRSCRIAPPPVSPAISNACASSASSRKSLAPIATT
ncbi:hypothetical protein [Aromatoleum evansii]|uniref:hypothetical protein n=1 Tax=Aromatoleum evansii TaxID=59406 RepID=UPI00145F779A|nr:hypothetical protein [Aromatoleum evansii]